MIAFFSIGIYPKATGGMEIFDYHLINALSRDEKIILITNTTKPNQNPGILTIPVCTRLFLLRRFGLGRISLFLTTLFQVWRYRRIIDVLHITATSNSGYYGSIFPRIQRMTGIPYIITFHGGGLYPWKKKSGFHELFKNAVRCIAVSSPIKDTLEKRTGNQFELILPLLPYSQAEKSKDELRKKFGIDPESTVIIMVGSLKPIKGSLFVADAFAGLGIQYLSEHRLILLFAGDGIYKAPILDTIHNYKIPEFVRLPGNVPNETIHEVFALADIYVIASEFEGTSISLLEAMFNALPVVASNVNGIRNIIRDGENGFLFEFSDKTGFQSQLKRAVENKELSSLLGRKAKQTYESSYAFQTTVNAYKDVFKQTRLKNKN